MLTIQELRRALTPFATLSLGVLIAAGSFDYRSPPEDWSEYSADQNGSFIRLLNEVGLKLETGTGDVETLTIDHAELPTPN
ncbi:MAG TPA: hypothetical protein VKB38_20625 [Terracidiphilus sp.]|nr:hypothetical protein [Terracidiphilus sp.]